MAITNSSNYRKYARIRNDQQETVITAMTIPITNSNIHSERAHNN